MKKTLFIMMFLAVATGAFLTADDFSGWIVAKYKDGGHAVGIGESKDQPMILMLGKDGRHAAAIGLQIVDGKSELVLVHHAGDKKQTQILSSLPFAIQSKPKGESSLGTSENPIRVVWNKTPEEQEIEIGDWVIVRGYVHDFVAAGLTTQDGRTFIDYSPFHENVIAKGREMRVYCDPKREIKSKDSQLGFVSSRISVPHLNPVVVDINLFVSSEKWKSLYVEITSRVTDMTNQHGKWNIGTDPGRHLENSGIRFVE